jgi:hypothetical protein
MDDRARTWVDTELDGCDLGDKRLAKRLQKVLAQLGGAMGQSIPFACQDWANAKAAYRFLPASGSMRPISWLDTFSRPGSVPRRHRA